jgi:hypothetical protein
VNQPYDISAQTGQSISFYWGEKPGVETLKATVTIQGGFGQATATAEDKFTVLDPGWTGKVFALNSASIQKLPEDRATDWLVYESPTQTPGITWSPAPKIQVGTFQVVQIMTSGTVTYSNPNYNQDLSQERLEVSAWTTRVLARCIRAIPSRSAAGRELSQWTAASARHRSRQENLKRHVCSRWWPSLARVGEPDDAVPRPWGRPFRLFMPSPSCPLLAVRSPCT